MANQIIKTDKWGVTVESRSQKTFPFETHLTLSETPTAVPTVTVAPRTLNSDTFFSQPYSSTAPNVPNLKQRWKECHITYTVKWFDGMFKDLFDICFHTELCFPIYCQNYSHKKQDLKFKNIQGVLGNF